MNLGYLLPPLVVAGISTILLVIVLLKGRQQGVVYRIFSLLLLSMTLWALAIFAMRASPDAEHALLWERAVPAIGFATAVFCYHFSLSLTKIQKRRVLLHTSYLFMGVVAALSPTSLFIQRMDVYSYGYAPIIGPAVIPVLAFAYFLSIMALYNLVKGYRTSHLDEERNRLFYITMAMVFPLVGSVVDLFPTVYPASIFGNIAFCLLTSVAILKYHLLDIRVVVRKSLVYLLVSIVIAIPYVGILYLLNFIFKPILELWWVHPIIILLLAIVLRPLYSWAQNVVDRMFYRERYDYLKALEQFSQKAQSVVNLKESSSTLTQLVSGALRTSSTCLLLPSESDNGLIVVSSTGLGSPPSGVVLKNSSPLVTWLKLQQRILSSKEFNIVPQLQSLSLREKNNLEQMEAKLCVPIQTGPGQLSGILVLGQKISQQPYSGEDRQLLTALSSQMAIALENARLYNESQQEVEERKRAEAALKLQKAYFQQLFDNSPEAIAWLDDTDRVVQVNKGFETLFGYRAEEIKGRFINELIIPEDRIEEASALSRAALNNKALRKETVRKRKDGSLVDVSALGYPIRFGNKLVGVYVIYSDITERKQAEEALLKYKMAVDSSADLIAAVGQHYVYIFANQTFLKYTCLKQDQVIGHTVAEVLGEEVFIKTVKPNVDRCLQGQTVEYEMEHHYPEVGRRHLDVSYHPLKSSNKQTIGVVAVIRDVTERKKAEEREKKLQQELYLSSRLASIGELAAGVAHQINNPLTGVLGFSQRLLRKSTDQKVSHDLEIIHNEAQRAAKVVENLLTFAHRRQPKKQYSDINEILQSALELRAYELKTSNIEVVTDLAPSLPQVMIDFHQMQEAFLNIILNAGQVMTEAHSGGRLTIKTEKRKGYIKATFTDDGPGIARGHLDKIFDPFFSTRGERGGTGLGLSVCHGIIAEHGGRIYAKSKPGKGATFFVELPITSGTDNKHLIEKK